MIDPLEHLFTRPAGSAVAAITPAGAAILCREDRAGLASYPMPCPVALRLHAWEVNRVIVCAFLVRLDGRDRSTWETWLNAHDAGPGGLGRRLVESLAVQPEVDVHLYVRPSDRPARSLRSPNLLKTSATDLLARADLLGPWSMADFDRAREAVYGRYPSVAALWTAGDAAAEDARA